MSLIDYIIGTVLVVLGGFFAYMSSHFVSEKKAGHTIPLPWEHGNEKQTTNSKRPQTHGQKLQRESQDKATKRGILGKIKGVE